jgi:hypothetical protein
MKSVGSSEDLPVLCERHASSSHSLFSGVVAPSGRSLGCWAYWSAIATGWSP